MIKKIFTSLVAAALCCLPVVSGQCADSIKVSLRKGLSPSEMEATAVRPAGASGDFYQTKDARSIKEDYAYTWYMVRIPLQVAARATDKTPMFVDEMKVTVYVVMMGGKNADRPFLLKRELTYVDIPLNPRAGADGTVVNVGVFLSPLDAARICGPDVTHPDLSKRLGAVAVLAKFHDSSCNNTSASPDLIVARELKTKLGEGSWWKNEKASSAGATLKSIAETPFAPYYSPLFPPTSPMYGSAAGAVTSAPDTTVPATPASAGDTTPTPAADDTTATDTPAEGEDDTATGGKKKKGKKNKRNR